MVKQQSKKIVSPQAKQYTFEEIQRTLFRKPRPKPRTVEEMEEGIRNYVKGAPPTW